MSLKDNKPVKPRTLLELDHRHCRWPVAVQESPTGFLHLFCCKRAPEGRSYCDKHHALAHDRPPYRRLRP